MTALFTTEQFLGNLDPQGAWDSEQSSHPLQPLRKMGLDHFRSTRFPNRSQEDWRSFPLKHIIGKKYHYAEKKENPHCEVFSEWRGPQGLQCVFNNGHFSPQESNLDQLPETIQCLRLDGQDARIATFFQEHLKKFPLKTDNPFLALNQALLGLGLHIHVPDNIVLSEPIHITYFSSAFDQNFLTCPRTLITLGKNAKAQVLESHVCFSKMPYLTNAVTEINLGEGADLQYARVQSESGKSFHVGQTHAQLGRDSQLQAFSLCTGAKISRQDMSVTFSAPGGTARLDGLYALKDSQYADHHTSIEHAFPNCSSNQIYKGILSGSSRALFNGKVIVKRDAVKSDSSQLNQNLLLSPDCRVDAKPELQIDADDVKCTHGATVGQLSREEQFYLQSRGIAKEMATSILVHGFADAVLQRVNNTFIRGRLQALMARYYTYLEGTEDDGSTGRWL